MLEHAQRFGEELRQALGSKAKVTHLVMDGEIHETLFPIAVSRGLRDFLAR